MKHPRCQTHCRCRICNLGLNSPRMRGWGGIVRNRQKELCPKRRFGRVMSCRTRRSTLLDQCSVLLHQVVILPLLLGDNFTGHATTANCSLARPGARNSLLWGAQNGCIYINETTRACSRTSQVTGTPLPER
jgi:hypothetical protein